jgi:NAD(P)-dependent dehydrogenase (short-subunit alcohol dehydrogenase family)
MEVQICKSLGDTLNAYVGNNIHVSSDFMSFTPFQELSKSLETATGKLHAVKCDVGNEADVLAAFKWVKNNLGGVDILINNAAVGHDTSLIGKCQVNLQETG